MIGPFGQKLLNRNFTQSGGIARSSSPMMHIAGMVLRTLMSWVSAISLKNSKVFGLAMARGKASAPTQDSGVGNGLEKARTQVSST